MSYLILVLISNGNRPGEFKSGRSEVQPSEELPKHNFLVLENMKSLKCKLQNWNLKDPARANIPWASIHKKCQGTVAAICKNRIINGKPLKIKTATTDAPKMLRCNIQIYLHKIGQLNLQSYVYMKQHTRFDAIQMRIFKNS